MPPLATHSVLPSGSSSTSCGPMPPQSIRRRAGRRRPRRRRCRAHRVRHRSHFRWRPAAGRRRRTRHGRRNAGPAAGPVQRAGRAIQAEAQREEARLAAEDHGAPAGRVNGEAVATRRHRHDAQVAARFVQQRGLVAAALARAQVAGPAGPRGLGGPFCFGGQGRDRYMAQPQRGPSARKRRRSIAIERVEADGHAQRGRQVLVDHRLGVLQGQPGQRPLAARLAVAGHVLGRRRVAQGLRGARHSPRTASSIQLPPCGSG